MELTTDPHFGAFRDQARTWLEENKPREPRPRDGAEVRAFDAAWQRRMFDDGWAGLDWPAEYGGRGLSLLEQVIWYEEYAASGAPNESILQVALNHAGPTLIRRASDEQKAFHLPKILRGEAAWSQGFSEPNSGSDLASLQCRGVVDGDHLVVTGQKTWTSTAENSDYQELLVRTDPEAPRHKGITWVIGDMSLPGIEVRPIRTIDRKFDFCEVFYDEVRIPIANVVDGVNNGWSVAMATLEIERSVAFLHKRLEWIFVVDELIEIASERGLLGDEGWAARLALLRAEALAVRALAYSLISTSDAVSAPGPVGIVNRMFHAELSQRIAATAIELLGVNALRWTETSERYMRTFAETIAGGTSDIQRNIIGERVLGLPR